MKVEARGAYWSQSPRRRTLQTRDFEIGVEVKGIRQQLSRALGAKAKVGTSLVARRDEYAGTPAKQSVRRATQEIASQKIGGVKGSLDRVGGMR